MKYRGEVVSDCTKTLAEFKEAVKHDCSNVEFRSARKEGWERTLYRHSYALLRYLEAHPLKFI